jgi:tRNA (cmo5U34)-methyltransferase
MGTDTHTPGEKWEFNAEVTEVFENMLERSIPQYHVMREACAAIGSRYVQPGTAIVDIGCSRGSALEPFILRFGARNRFLALDVSEPMLEATRKRFAGYIETKVVDVRKHDLRTGLPQCDASLVLSVLTLQFTPIEYRMEIVASIYDRLRPGCAAIIVEKVLGSSLQIDKDMTEVYYSLKNENGYSAEAITRKRQSLEGVLVPVTASWNEQLFRQAGFRHIDCFWRWMNFAAWVAVK